MNTRAKIHAAYLWGERLVVLTGKELLQLGRDRILMVFVLYAFIVPVYLSGSGISFELRNAPTYVIDRDHSAASREITRRFRMPFFHRKGSVDSAEEGMEKMDRGEAMVLLTFPPDFEREMHAAPPATMQMQVDTSNTVTGFLATSYGQRILAAYALDRAARRLGAGGASMQAAPIIAAEHRVYYNPNQKDSWFMSVTELLIVLSLFSIILPAAAMAREKEQGTIEQLLVTPLSPLQILLPKVLAMTAVVVVGAACSTFVVLKPAFDVPMRGSLPLFFALLALYVLAMTGLGLVVANVTRNMAQVGMLSIMIFVPIMFLSGIWTPPEAMPPWMRRFVEVSPLYHFIHITLSIFLKGSGLRLLWPSIVKMAALGGALFLFGVWRLRRQFR